MNEKDKMNVANDYAESRGEAAYLAYPGERVVIYSPTWIVMGNVTRVGPLVIELEDAGIVYDTGQHGEFRAGAEAWSGLEFTPWLDSIMRVPAIGVIVVSLKQSLV